MELPRGKGSWLGKSLLTAAGFLRPEQGTELGLAGTTSPARAATTTRCRLSRPLVPPAAPRKARARVPPPPPATPVPVLG